MTLDNTESTVDVEFVVTSTIDSADNKKNYTVNAGKSEPLTFEVSHGSEWSLRWEASDPTDQEGDPESGSLPDDGPKTVDCPSPPVFDPDVRVAELVC